MDGHQSSGSLAALLLGLGLLGGCSADALDAGGRSKTAAFGRPVEYEAVSCWFEAPSEREVSCGWLAVPEDWAAENSRAIHLPVVVFRAASGGARQEPVLFLNGGPGARSRIESEQEIASWLGFLSHEFWTRERDFIVLAQRGTNWSDSNCRARRCRIPRSTGLREGLRTIRPTGGKISTGFPGHAGSSS
jgi:hypothetical protein